MNYAKWRPGDPITPPVYMDANVLVGASITQHPLYPNCASVLGELLSSNSEILISTVAISEQLWAASRISYCKLMNQPQSANFNKVIYKKWCAQIFAKHWATIGGLHSLLNRLLNSGHPIDVIPKSSAECIQVTSRTLNYMQQLSLTPADAMHLALAEAYAQTFVTADGDFRKVASQLPTGPSLVILGITP